MLANITRVTEARRLALALMGEHRLEGWTFGLNHRKRSMGLCSYAEKRISLSVYYVTAPGTTPEQLRDTILHEIAHALCGAAAGHGWRWKLKCLEIGARPVRCGDADMPEGSWQAVCPCCGSKATRFRKPKRMEGWFCRRCGRTRGKLTWQRV